MLLEIMLKHVQVHTSTTEMQRVFMNGSFALDFALLEGLVTNISKRCQMSATDCVATRSPQLKRLASIICAKLLTEDRVVSTR